MIECFWVWLGYNNRPRSSLSLPRFGSLLPFTALFLSFCFYYPSCSCSYSITTKSLNSHVEQRADPSGSQRAGNYWHCFLVRPASAPDMAQLET
jgi:hypothetical protein